ncbi:MAG: hypothetical protein KAS59_07205 [Alphaproteobacteria bacterium]|nr:hypothetical protein [Alphaproteobacteria bacterium]
MSNLFAQVFNKLAKAFNKEKAKYRYFPIGYTGTAEEVEETFRKIKGVDEMHYLLEGVREAFEEKRPKNLQTVVAGYSLGNFSDKRVNIGQLFEGMDDKQLQLATAKLFDEQPYRCQILLASVVRNGLFDGKDSSVEAAVSLLDAEKCSQDNLDSLLCDACGAGKTDIVESLYKKGADFIGALRDNRIFDDTKHHQKILLYQKQFVGESTPDLSQASVRNGQGSGLPRP